MTHAAAELHCGYPGCPVTTRVLARHLDNVTASGGWWCAHHDDDESGVLAEVPC